MRSSTSLFQVWPSHGTLHHFSPGHSYSARWYPKMQLMTNAPPRLLTHLPDLQHHRLPQQGSRNLTPQANSILQKVWKAKSTPPFLKTFTWRLNRRALTTTKRAGRYSTHIDQCCASYGAIENDIHLLFLCDTPRQLWNSSNFTLPMHLLDPTEDGAQFVLPFLITTTPIGDALSQFLFIAWYIWKARIFFGLHIVNS